jgi:hypothetical protein
MKVSKRSQGAAPVHRPDVFWRIPSSSQSATCPWKRCCSSDDGSAGTSTQRGRGLPRCG